MPRYGDADSIKWFDVEPNCTFQILNCFKDGDEVSCRNIYLKYFCLDFYYYISETDKRKDLLIDKQ